MLTGELRNQIDRIWDAFWSGGISNPLEVIEQITYLLFLRRLDELQTLQELKAERLKKPIERRIFPEGKDPKKRPYKDFRWSHFKNLEPREMYTVVSEHVFPFLRTLGGDVGDAELLQSAAWLSNDSEYEAQYEGDGSTVLRGPLPDEAALHGVLIKVRDLALPLLGVKRMATGAEMRESHEADGGTNSETW